MRLSHITIKNGSKNLGNTTRSSRNEWAETIEDIVRDLAPLPITYDVDSTQGICFSEFSYTEIIGGMYLNTQNIEINVRIIQEASKVTASSDYKEKLLELCEDKYVLSETRNTSIKDVGFMTGQNMFDMVSRELVARIAFENPDFKMKLHPLTDYENVLVIGNMIGHDKIIMPDVSGVELLKNCETAYTTMASELTIMAVLFDKKIVNISNFFNESGGNYYPISRLLFNEEDKMQVINNIIDCEFSGIIMPFMGEDEVIRRIKAYFNKALELREKHRPLASANNLKKIPINGGR